MEMTRRGIAKQNIAYRKPTRSNCSKSDSFKVTDGDTASCWAGMLYPSYVDIDLLDTYDIDEVKLYFPEGNIIYYTLYGSNDGSNYTYMYAKHMDEVTTSDGDSILFNDTQKYRILRVYIEYVKGTAEACLSEVEVFGEKTDEENTDTLREGTFEEVLKKAGYDVTRHSDSTYANPITEEETIHNIYGIIERTLNREYNKDYTSWFTFELKNNTENDHDYYEISYRDGKIHIVGNIGLSLAVGLNYYLKYYCKVNVAEQTISGHMPREIVPVERTIRKETPYAVRYAYNYCTLSYSYAFYGVDEWQRENDWLALSGVNCVLDLAGQEATWILFLMNFGYSFDDAKDWLTGPAYYAWQFMDNMEVFGGPVYDGYVVERMELARKSQRFKRSLGMQTILQAYAGMIPTNFGEYQPEAPVIPQGIWNGFARPYMIATDSDTYDEYARLFYAAQEYVYGATTNYYAVDPFHEGGKRPSDLSDQTIAEEVLNSLLEYDPDGVWVVQSWQSNPTNSLLKGMAERKEHVLVVDLIKYPICDATTKYDNLSYGNTKLDSVEFNGTNWVWCLLGNFGGNPSMKGQIEDMVKDIFTARATYEHMTGIGVISEAMNDNPIVYDLLFDLIWAEPDFDLNQWVSAYIERRYGGTSVNAELAWKYLIDTCYSTGVHHINEVFGMKNITPRGYRVQSIQFDVEDYETALKLLLKDFELLKDSEGYLYDLTEIMRQHVSNYAVLIYNQLLDAEKTGDLKAFKILKEKFLNAFVVLNAVQSTQRDQLGGEWIGKAQDIAAGYDDFSKKAFELNAKTLITSWGSYLGHKDLKDYAWRNYEGIFLDVYYKIWAEYLERVEAYLETGIEAKHITVSEYFDFYWKWILGDQNYTRDAKDSPEDVYEISRQVLKECSVAGEWDPSVGDIALHGLVQNGVLDLIGVFGITKINVVTEDAASAYEVYVSEDNQNWIKVGGKGIVAAEAETELVIKVKHINARYVKVVGMNLDSSVAGKIRVYGERILPERNQLGALIAFAEGVDTADADGVVDKTIKAALEDAKNSYKNEAAPDAANRVYWKLYDTIIEVRKTAEENESEGE